MLKEKLNQRGITLIALIITIIVMLILVGVSVTVALNGGLFTTAKNAVDRTGEEKDREMGLSEGQIEIGGKIYNSYQDYLDKKPVRQDPESNAPDALLDYILGEKDETTGQRPGRELSEIFSLENFSFIEESIPEELQEGDLTLVSLANVSQEATDIYITYEEKTYKFRVSGNADKQQLTTLEEVGVKDLSYNTESRVGKHVSYDGIDWIVLYDDNENGLQMISADIIKDENNNPLEYNLKNMYTESEITEIDGRTGKSNLEKAMYAYNKLVTTLNTICEDLVTPKAGVIKGVRSVGSNPITPNEDNSKTFIGSPETIPGYGTSTWFEDNLNLQLNKTEERTYYTIKGTNPAQEYTIKDMDYNYEKDFDRMVALGIVLTETCYKTDSSYYLASRFINYDYEESYVKFGHREVYRSACC